MKVRKMMHKKEINIDSIKGMKLAEKYQAKGWICIHNGFFNPIVTMVKGTEEEISKYREIYK